MSEYCTCKPCPKNYYMDVDNSETECKPCTSIGYCAGGNQYQVGCPEGSTRDNYCADCRTTCPSPYYELSECGSGKNAECSLCPLPEGKTTYCAPGQYFVDPFDGKYST